MAAELFYLLTGERWPYLRRYRYLNRRRLFGKTIPSLDL
jgi:hypothetical protein